MERLKGKINLMVLDQNCTCIYVYMYMHFQALSTEKTRNNNTTSSQILVSKYHTPLKEIGTSLEIGLIPGLESTR